MGAETVNEITIIKPDDMHVHLRQGEDLVNYARDTEKSFKRAIVMPNTLPPVTTPLDVENYRNEIIQAAPGLEPLMTFKILPSTRPEDIAPLKKAGVLAGKFYPAGATTNSEDGITVSNWKIMLPVMHEMAREGMVFSMHGEVPEAFILDREKAFLPILKEMTEEVPGLKIILEHVSSKEGVEAVLSLPDNVRATVTLHHLVSTLQDVLGDINNLCMPVIKLPEDREAIRKVVFEGNKKFFFGSDSAPHKKEFKNCAKAKAGAYTAPVLLGKLAELFEEAGVLDKLENFVSVFGAEFYELPQNSEKITLVKEDVVVPEEMWGVTPYLAGETVSWKIRD